MGTGSGAAVVFHAAPASRTYTIPAETRIYTIPAEDRTYVVPADA
jgi:hypothetical protein